MKETEMKPGVLDLLSLAMKHVSNKGNPGCSLLSSS